MTEQEIVAGYARRIAYAVQQIARGKVDDPVLFARQTLWRHGQSPARAVEFAAGGRDVHRIQRETSLEAGVAQGLKQVMEDNVPLTGGAVGGSGLSESERRTTHEYWSV